jgi:hypothetical protein
MTVQTTSAAQPVSGVWDMFSNFANLYMQDRQAERAQVAAFNQYSYNALAASDKNNFTGWGVGGNTAATNGAIAAGGGGGFVLTTNHLVIGAVFAAAVYFAVK